MPAAEGQEQVSMVPRAARKHPGTRREAVSHSSAAKGKPTAADGPGTGRSKAPLGSDSPRTRLGANGGAGKQAGGLSAGCLLGAIDPQAEAAGAAGAALRVRNAGMWNATGGTADASFGAAAAEGVSLEQLLLMRAVAGTGAGGADADAGDGMGAGGRGGGYTHAELAAGGQADRMSMGLTARGLNGGGGGGSGGGSARGVPPDGGATTTEEAQLHPREGHPGTGFIVTRIGGRRGGGGVAAPQTASGIDPETPPRSYVPAVGANSDDEELTIGSPRQPRQPRASDAGALSGRAPLCASEAGCGAQLGRAARCWDEGVQTVQSHGLLLEM